MSIGGNRVRRIPLLFAGLAVAACASSGGERQAAQEDLAVQQERLATLEQQLRDKDRALVRTQSEVKQLSQQLASQTPDVAARPPSLAGGGDVLPKARPGECYAKVLVPAQFKTETERVLRQEATQKIEIVPAQYEMVTDRVLVEPARTVWRTGRGSKSGLASASMITAAQSAGMPSKVDPGQCFVEFFQPAQFKTETERVLKREATKKLEVVPAQYEWVEEKVLVKPAHTIWKKGRGPIERVDNATGEIMCLVEVPAKYETVKKRVLKAPTTTREIAIPAQYETVTKRMQTAAAAVSWVPEGQSAAGKRTGNRLCLTEIPAKHKTVQVRKVKAPAKENRIAIPAKYETVTKRAKISEERMEWRPVLCQTNTTPELIASVQRALREAGHNPGPIDGRIGPQTLTAVRSYQQKKGLPTGGLTLTTLNSLGVNPGQ